MGSSANRTVGCETSARAMATRCCWPPESCDGLWPRRSPRPTRSISAATRRPCRACAPAIESGSEDVLLRREHRQQVELLEDEADVPAAQLGQVLVGHLGDVLAADLHAAVGRAVEPGEQVHERRLAGARRAHDGRELADGDLEGDAAQRVHRRLALAVLAGDAPGGDRDVEGRGGRAAVEVWVSTSVLWFGGQAGQAASAARRDTAWVSAPAERRALVASPRRRPVMPLPLRTETEA